MYDAKMRSQSATPYSEVELTRQQRAQPPHSRSPISSRFLSLPLELRQEIYRYLLVKPVPFVVNYLYYKNTWNRPSGLSRQYYSWLRDWLDVKLDTFILLVSSQVSDEALDVLYGENTYEVRLEEGDQNFIGRFAPENRSRIRRLQLQLQPMGLWHKQPKLEIEPQIWIPILATASRICIIAQRPMLYTGYFDEIKIGEWLDWLHPILDFINQHVPQTRRIIMVDDDNRIDTARLMEVCFPRGYRKLIPSPEIVMA